MRIKKFNGIAPKVSDINAAETMAQVAMDVDLTSGTLKPWRDVKLLETVGEDTETMYVYGCHKYYWDRCVTAAPWLPNCPRLYLTGRMDYPEVGVIDQSGGIQYQRLGVPVPETPQISTISTKNITVDTAVRMYVTTFVNNLGEEGGPSYPSSELMVNGGSEVILSGFRAPSPEYNVESVRIYRSATGYRTGSEKEQIVDTQWLFVAEVPVGTTVFRDTVLDKHLGSALWTREFREPPRGITQIIEITGTASLAGFCDNKLYFSRNHQPWNWPLELEVTLDDNIVHIQEDNGKIFVSTTGRPYIVDANIDCGDRPTRAVVMSDYPMPDIACAHPKASSITPFGMVYASTDGIILLSETRAPVILTKSLLSVDQWRKLRPETARFSYYKGHVICATDMVTLMLLLDMDTYEGAALTTLSDSVTDMQLTNSGELIIMYRGQVYQFDAGGYYRPYTWHTVELYSPSRTWFTVGQIETTGSVEMTLYAEHMNYVRQVNDNRPFRVPRLGRSTRHSVKITGTEVVSMIQLSETMTSIGG